MKLQDRMYAYETLLHRIHIARVMGNEKEVIKLLDLISAWDSAHKCGNGEQSDKDCQNNIDRFVNRMIE